MQDKVAASIILQRFIEIYNSDEMNAESEEII